MKKLLLFSILLLVFSNTYSQIISSGSSPLTNTTSTPNQVAAIIVPPPPPPNVIAFDYDVAGNQWKRRFIYVASGIYRMADQPFVKQPKTEDLVESDIDKNIMYYPNPVQSELFVQWSNSENNFVESIELYSITGQLMRRFDNLKNDENNTINFEAYPSGHYILNLSYTDGTAKDLRIIKK